jgi:hypothetical protein
LFTEKGNHKAGESRQLNTIDDLFNFVFDERYQYE